MSGVVTRGQSDGQESGKMRQKTEEEIIEVQDLNRLEIIELEMRARAIKAMLQTD